MIIILITFTQQCLSLVILNCLFPHLKVLPGTLKLFQKNDESSIISVIIYPLLRLGLDLYEQIYVCRFIIKSLNNVGVQ